MQLNLEFQSVSKYNLFPRFFLKANFESQAHKFTFAYLLIKNCPIISFDVGFVHVVAKATSLAGRMLGNAVSENSPLLHRLDDEIKSMSAIWKCFHPCTLSLKSLLVHKA